MSVVAAAFARPLAAAALCLARIARRPARLLCLHRLHRARRHVDCRRRLACFQSRRRAGAPGPGHSRRRSVVHAGPARGFAAGTFLPAKPRQSLERRHVARHGPHRRRQGHAGRIESGRRRLSAVRPGRARSARALGRRARATRRRIRRCRRSHPADAARPQTGRAADHRQRDYRDSRRAHRASPTSSPAASASVRGCW